MQRRRGVQNTRVGTLGVVSVLAIFFQCGASGEPDSWLPATCKSYQPVGLHDSVEENSDPQEEYLPAQFVPSTFELEENKTFSALLSDDESLFVRMRVFGDADVIEFECERIRGRNGEDGWLCRNNPPSELIMIAPESNRFTRAALASFVFFAPSDLDTGASLFVEHGLCFPSEPGSQWELPAISEDADARDEPASEDSAVVSSEGEG